MAKTWEGRALPRSLFSGAQQDVLDTIEAHEVDNQGFGGHRVEVTLNGGHLMTMVAKTPDEVRLVQNTVFWLKTHLKDTLK